MHATGRHVATLASPRRRGVLIQRQGDILVRNIIARMHLAAAHARRLIRLFVPTQIAGEIDKGDIRYLHEARSRI